MNAVGTERQCDVHAVVDDEARAVSTRDLESFRCGAREITRREMFLAQLNQARATLAELRDLFGMRQAGEPRVCNRIKLWQLDSHRSILLIASAGLSSSKRFSAQSLD